MLHAGLYYKPCSVKAQVCVAGARRLGAWVESRNLPLNACGKVIVPHARAGPQLDVLAERGLANGATVESGMNPAAAADPPSPQRQRSCSPSPNTAVVKPIAVVRRLQQELQEQGVSVLRGSTTGECNPTCDKFGWHTAAQSVTAI